MTLKCYNKPNRSKPRLFSAKDCGRIVCKAVDQGQSRAEIWRRVEPCLGDPCEKVRVRAFVNAVLEAGAAIAIALTAAIAVMRIARVALALVLRIPVVRRYVLRLMGQVKSLEDAFTKARDITGQAEVLEKVLNQKWGP